MAKARGKKGARKKSNSESGGGSGLILSIIAVVIAGAVAYGMFLRPGAEGLSGVSDVNLSDYLPESTGNVDADKAENISKQMEPKKEDPVAKTDPKDVSSLDGKIEKEETNQNLPTYEEVTPYYFTSSFDFTWPAYTSKDAIIEHEFYALRYNEKTEQADWVAYKLTADDLNNAKFKRKDNFREDPNVKTNSASPADYKGSGYDRGHLAAAADFTWNKLALDESFYMSNMSPQLPGFNRGIWKKLEEKTRSLARSNGTVYIVTGPIFTGKSDKIGKNKVAIPDKYYKVVIELTGNDIKGIGFILDHEKSSASLSSFSMSIDEVEKITGLDFFPTAPDDIEKRLECCARYSDW